MMENVWEKIKSLKGRPWSETESILGVTTKDLYLTEDSIQTYNVNAETLPEQDREIYGLHLKSEPFFLVRCKLCSRLVKASVLENHIDFHHKRNGITLTKKCNFISPSKKKHSKRSNRSTSEDDSESIISSETSSPTVDLPENSDSNISVPREDSLVDGIPAEISEDSKPPTPGPQDLYEEFAVSYSEESCNSISSTGDQKPIKLKIISNKDGIQKLQTTSLLEAHLLSNTKYTTSSGITNTDVCSKSLGYRFDSKNDRHGNASNSEPVSFRSSEEFYEQKESRKSSLPNNTSSNNSVMKSDTKISIPISVLSQNVKIGGNSLKKQHPNSLKSALPKTNLRSIDSKDTQSERTQFSSQYTEKRRELSQLSSAEEKSQTPSRSKKNKRSELKNRPMKSVEFDADKHCGVLIDENKRCLRSLTCKTHLVSLRRAVPGRSKKFDELLADHRACKEALKEQERIQNLNIPESAPCIPRLKIGKKNGNPVQAVRTNESEISRTLFANYSKSCDPVETEVDVEVPSEDDELISRRLSNNIKQICDINRQTPQYNFLRDEELIYSSDVKVSFVCSNALYKIGGLLYTDRSRQAIRKCMAPLRCRDSEQVKQETKQSLNMNNFFQVVKSGAKPYSCTKLNLFKQQIVQEVKEEDVVCSNEEIERMRNVLENSSKILNGLSSSNSCQLRELKLIGRKRQSIQSRTDSKNKRIKLESMSDENYDINSLLSFDKSMPNRNMVMNNGDSDIRITHDAQNIQLPSISSDSFLYSFPMNVDVVCSPNLNTINGERIETEHVINAGNSSNSISFLNDDSLVRTNTYAGNDNSQLWQTFHDLESEIRGTVDANTIQEFYVTQADGTVSAITASSDSNLVNVNAEVNDSIDPVISNIEETISKNYSLLEQYCKDITTDELLSDGKNSFEFLADSVPQPNESDIKVIRTSDIQPSVVGVDSSSSGGLNIANIYSNVGLSDTSRTDQLPSSELNFDTQVLSSYLSNISDDTASQNSVAHNVSDAKYVDNQFGVVKLENSGHTHLIIGRSVNQGQMTTLNEQFPGIC